MLLGILLISIALNILLFKRCLNFSKQCENLHDLLNEEAKDNVLLQSKLNKYDKLFKQYCEPKQSSIIIEEDDDYDDYDDYDDTNEVSDYDGTTPTIIIDED